MLRACKRMASLKLLTVVQRRRTGAVGVLRTFQHFVHIAMRVMCIMSGMAMTIMVSMAVDVVPVAVMLAVFVMRVPVVRFEVVIGQAAFVAYMMPAVHITAVKNMKAWLGTSAGQGALHCSGMVPGQSAIVAHMVSALHFAAKAYAVEEVNCCAVSFCANIDMLQ